MRFDNDDSDGCSGDADKQDDRKGNKSLKAEMDIGTDAPDCFIVDTKKC